MEQIQAFFFSSWLFFSYYIQSITRCLQMWEPWLRGTNCAIKVLIRREVSYTTVTFSSLKHVFFATAIVRVLNISGCSRRGLIIKVYLVTYENVSLPLFPFVMSLQLLRLEMIILLEVLNVYGFYRICLAWERLESLLLDRQKLQWFKQKNP